MKAGGQGEGGQLDVEVGGDQGGGDGERRGTKELGWVGVGGHWNVSLG